MVVCNPSTGGVTTEGGKLLIEETFTDTGGMKIEIPVEEGAYTEAADEHADALEEAEEALADSREATVEAQMAQLAAAAADADDETIAAAEEAQASAEEAVAAYLEALAEAQEAETARLAAAATVEVSADGTQQTVKDANGFTATAITSDTGVVITMDAEPLTVALENLRVGALQEVITSDGTPLVVRQTDSDDGLRYYNPDGSEATSANGEPYTVSDLAALSLTFYG